MKIIFILYAQADEDSERFSVQKKKKACGMILLILILFFIKVIQCPPGLFIFVSNKKEIIEVQLFFSY